MTPTTAITTTLYSNFVNSLRSEATKRFYIYGLNKYMQYYHFGLEDLVKDNAKIIETNIIQYITWLKQDQKLSSMTIESYLSTVIHFYSMNDVILNRKKIGMYLGEYVRKQKDRAYTTEEIANLLEFCDERSKALVLLMASTGMRIGALADLQQRHLEKIKEFNLYKIIVYEGTKEEYYCFTTPEAALAIDTYLDYRKRCGEKLTDDSPLFREQFDINDLEQIKKYPRRLTTIALAKLLVRQLNRSGVMPTGKETEGSRRGRKRNPIARAHGFRKFATTNMIRAKVNAEAREMLLGHSIGLTTAYYRPDESELLSEYLKAVDLLTINQENRLRLENEELKEEKSQMKLMKEQFNAMQSQMQSILSIVSSTSQKGKEEIARRLIEQGTYKAKSDIIGK